MGYGRQLSQAPVTLATLICLQTVVCCIALIYTSYFHADFHVYYDPARLFGAAVVVAIFTLFVSIFLFTSFSYGYFVAYYFCMMVTGFLWMNYFTDLNYDHNRAALSAAISAIAFLLVARTTTPPVSQAYVMSTIAFERLLVFILAWGMVTVAISAVYNFRILGLGNINEFRNELAHAYIRNELRSPAIVNYLVGITTNALLPFAFACFVARKRYWHALIVLSQLLFFFPITLSKLSLFTPVWLVFIAVLARFLEARIAVVLSLLLPMLAGLAAVISFGANGGLFFDLLVFRMMVIPSSAMAIYNDFFSHHELTYFCQISFLKSIVNCPYGDQLGIVMERAYGFGHFNGSLFVTEGIASVGTIFAPLAALICGAVISLGNRLSAGLPLGLIMMSSAILPQILLNVPLTTALLTHGMLVLYLLWYVTPRAVFETQQADASVSRPAPNRLLAD